MAKVKNFKTIFPAVSVPLNDDYSIRASRASSATATPVRSRA